MTADRICEFGFPGPLRDRLVAAVLDGTKTATTCLLAEYEAAGESLPRAGEHETVVDSGGLAVATIEIAAVDVLRLAEVGDDVAVAEAESYADAAGWRAEHERFWHDEVIPAWPPGVPVPRIDDDLLVVVLRFRLVAA